jgi:hypothetical protein
MSDSEKMDLNFRYRPNVDSPDAILIRYLESTSSFLFSGSLWGVWFD